MKIQRYSKNSSRCQSWVSFFIIFVILFGGSVVKVQKAIGVSFLLSRCQSKSSSSTSQSTQESGTEDDDGDNDFKSKVEACKITTSERIVFKNAYLVYQEQLIFDPHKALISPPPKF